jgi:hypothetical protein
MPSIPVGFAEATFIWNLAGKPNDVTYAFGLDHPTFSIYDPAIWAQDLYGFAVGASKPIIPADIQIGWTFQGIQVVKQLEEGQIIGQYLLPVVGTATGGALPPNCAILMRKNSALGGRRNRGRVYLPPIIPGEANVDVLGNLSGSFATDIQTRWNTFRTGAEGDENTLVIFHQTAPFTPTPITGFTVATTIATQRRRLR